MHAVLSFCIGVLLKDGNHNRRSAIINIYCLSVVHYTMCLRQLFRLCLKVNEFKFTFLYTMLFDKHKSNDNLYGRYGLFLIVLKIFYYGLRVNALTNLHTLLIYFVYCYEISPIYRISILNVIYTVKQFNIYNEKIKDILIILYKSILNHLPNFTIFVCGIYLLLLISKYYILIMYVSHFKCVHSYLMLAVSCYRKYVVILLTFKLQKWMIN